MKKEVKHDHIGYLWYDKIKRRPCYGPLRTISRGKKKGWLEVWYMHANDERGLHYKKRIVPATDVNLLQ